MNLTAEQLAELLAGIARAQNAIIDAVDRANPGWRNTHLLPMLNVAANMRSAEPRLIDLPARVLLRSQNRAGVDLPTLVGDLERLASGAPAQPAAAQPATAVPAAVAPQAAPAAASSADELDFSAKK